MFLKTEIESFFQQVKKIDKKVAIIFLSIAILQTISWYYTSRRFFRRNFFNDLQFEKDVYLIEYLYWFIGDFFTFFILPALLIKFIHKEKLSNYGFSTGDYKTGLKISLLFLLIMIPLVWFASSQSSFSQTYPHLNSALTSWDIFFIYEAGMLLYMIGWEFIWRGYMLFGLKEKFGYYAILIQMIPFVILHNGKPAPEAFGSIAAGIALGVLALRTGSVFYCILTHLCVMFSIDLISTLRFRANEYGTGLDSFLTIIMQFF